MATWLESPGTASRAAGRVSLALAAAGAAVVLLATFAHSLGIGGATGFDRRQARAILAGAALLGAAWLLWPAGDPARLLRRAVGALRRDPGLRARVLGALTQGAAVAVFLVFAHRLLLRGGGWGAWCALTAAAGWLGLETGRGQPREAVWPRAWRFLWDRSEAGREALPAWLIAPALAGAAVWMAWFPIHQLRTTGYLCYQNAYDEMSYLQYEFSWALLGWTRAGQFLVHLGHHCGLSGAWINLALDTACLLLFPLLVRAIFRRLGYSATQAGLTALACTFLPIVFAGGCNPWLQHLLALA